MKKGARMNEKEETDDLRSRTNRFKDGRSVYNCYCEQLELS